MHIAKPGKLEYSPGHQLYLDKVTQKDLFAALPESGKQFSEFIRSIPGEKHNYRYARGKWNIKEIVSHVTDCERVFAYRALCFSRNDKHALPGFDEVEWTPESNANSRSIDDLLEEHDRVRNSTISLAKGLNREMSLRKGKANGKEISVRALLFIIPGHEQHHLGVIKERYL